MHSQQVCSFGWQRKLKSAGLNYSPPLSHQDGVHGGFVSSGNCVVPDKEANYT